MPLQTIKHGKEQTFLLKSVKKMAGSSMTSPPLCPESSSSGSGRHVTGLFWRISQQRGAVDLSKIFHHFSGDLGDVTMSFLSTTLRKSQITILRNGVSIRASNVKFFNFYGKSF